MPTKVKVSFPLAEKTITVERDVGENENVIEAIDSLLSEIASLSKLEMKGRGRGLKHEMTAAGPGRRWIYQTQQPSAKFVERYAKIVDEEEETEEKEVKNRQ